MIRTALCLTLILTQAVLAAPLYVCLSACGDVRLDSGAAACVGCSSQRRHHHEHGGCCAEEHSGSAVAEGCGGRAPCDCRHEPLSDEGQYVRRIEVVPVGDLLIADLDPIAAHEPAASLLSVTDVAASGPSHTPLTDQASVRLRC
jgi:hypothetical protein